MYTHTQHAATGMSPGLMGCQWFGGECSRILLQQISIVSSCTFVISVLWAAVITSTDSQKQIRALTVENTFARSAGVRLLPELLFTFFLENYGSQNNCVKLWHKVVLILACPGRRDLLLFSINRTFFFFSISCLRVLKKISFSVWNRH